ncbi:M15 family metallopeptidase [uncultured Aquimarina sp.]|uniref:M15 family metallopeptidase n=1 Tax=uncultured Aquimarina sp. TaxID=575652 RepID=UPI00261E0774|nr:M15 family metallopeptidase [uncultured Aquimarina sp.]
MLRKDFIKISGLGLTALSLSSLNMIQLEFTKDDLMGKSNPVFYGDTYKLRKEAHEAFLKMKNKASESGIKIKTVSSYRNYAHQNRIWERKYKKFTKEGLSPINTIKKIIEYSTIPGTSRHHWGTDIDIVDGTPKQPKGLLLEENFHEEGPFCKFKEWMDIHANSFGFYLVYTNKKNRKGFKYEPWHYSYAPLSIPMLKSYKKLDIKNELQNANLLGSNYFTVEFIQQYITENVLDINPKLL